MILTLPNNDLDDFAALPAKWRKEVDAWLRILQQVNIGQLTKLEAAREMRAGLSTLNRKLADFKRHGWRGLVPAYKGPQSLPDTFKAYWKNLVEENQRCTAAAWRELVRRWARKEQIDGYEGFPGWPNLPRGWGRDGRNLYRHKGTAFEITAMRQGFGKAAARHAPKVLGTRVGMWHLSHVAFDDVWLDMKTHLLTRQQLVRTLQLGALDVLSGCRFHYGTQPQLINKDDGTKGNLKEADMRHALASMLYNHGISPRGTTFLVEHGTAAIRDGVKDILKRAFGGLVKVDESGFTGKLQEVAGMHEGRGGGNPRHKSWLESIHNLMHNEFAALPGATGHDRTEPEWLHGMEKEVKWLFKVASRLPAEALQSLQFPTREYYTQLLPAIHASHEIINQRDWHDLEGWAELGFLTTEYRLTPSSNEWISQQDWLALPAPARLALAAVADTNPLCCRPRKLSPREVFNLGRSDPQAVVQVPHGVIAEILYQDLAQPRTCRDGYFVIQDTTIAPEPMHFESRIVRNDGREEELPDRQTFDLVVNPFDPKVAWVFSATRNQGAFLGLAKRVQRACRTDAEATKLALGRQMERMKDLTADLKDRHATASNGLSRRTLKRVKHNADVIESAQAAQAEKTRFAAAALDAGLPADSTTNNSHEDTTTYDPRDLWK